MEVLVELQHTLKDAGLFFNSLSGYLELIRHVQFVLRAVRLIEFSKRFNDVIVIKNLLFKILLAELVMGFEIFHGPVQQIHLVGPGDIEFIADLPCDEILGDGQEIIGAIDMIVFGPVFDKVRMPVFRIGAVVIHHQDGIGLFGENHQAGFVGLACTDALSEIQR